MNEGEPVLMCGCTWRHERSLTSSSAGERSVWTAPLPCASSSAVGATPASSASLSRALRISAHGRVWNGARGRSTREHRRVSHRDDSAATVASLAPICL